MWNFILINKAMFANRVGSSRGELLSVDNVCHGASAL